MAFTEKTLQDHADGAKKFRRMKGIGGDEHIAPPKIPIEEWFRT